jgi:hypothetical protein
VVDVPRLAEVDIREYASLLDFLDVETLLHAVGKGFIRFEGNWGASDDVTEEDRDTRGVLGARFRRRALLRGMGTRRGLQLREFSPQALVIGTKSRNVSRLGTAGLRVSGSSSRVRERQSPGRSRQEFPSRAHGLAASHFELRSLLEVVKELLRISKSLGRVKREELSRNGVGTVLVHAALKGLGDLAQEHLHLIHVDWGRTLVARGGQPDEIPVHLSDSLEFNDIIHPRDGVLPVHGSERVVRVLGRLREVKSVKHVDKLQERRINIVVRVFDVRHGV